MLLPSSTALDSAPYCKVQFSEPALSPGSRIHYGKIDVSSSKRQLYGRLGVALQGHVVHTVQGHEEYVVVVSLHMARFLF
jgi:hypothetical protein